MKNKAQTLNATFEGTPKRLLRILFSNATCGFRNNLSRQLCLHQFVWKRLSLPGSPSCPVGALLYLKLSEGQDIQGQERAI